MQQTLLSFLILLLPFTSHGQKEALYYFSGKDSTLFGVRTVTGKVIIPAIYESYLANPGEKVTEREILLIDKTAGKDDMAYDYRFKFFDRSGKFLYSPYWYDNGPDYYVEGLRRFVENGKVGFADRLGRKVIPAKYNHVEPFYRGYALACLDCRYTRFNNDDEHCCGYAGTKYSIIDRAGNMVHDVNAMKYGLNDSLLTALKLIPVFTDKERSLIEVLGKLPEVKKLTKDNSGNICTVIAEKPKGQNDFYFIVFRAAESYSYGDLCFLIGESGTPIYHITNDGDLESLAKWRKHQ